MKKILIVVDMQNDFITGSLGTPEAQAVVPKVVDVIEKFDVVIATQDTHYEENYYNTLEGEKLPVLHCAEDESGWFLNEDVWSSFIECENPMCVNKPTFGSLCLVEELRTLQYRYGEFELYLTGVCTDICVVSNALLLRAAFPNTKIVVYEDCCAGTTPENHQAALTVMKSCQIDIERSVEE